MKVKRFYGKTTQEAIEKVKSEVGAEAMIISNRSVRRGGLFGLFSKKAVEVSVALDPLPRSEDHPGIARVKKRTSPETPAPSGPAYGRNPVFTSELNEMRTIRRPQPKGRDLRSLLHPSFQHMLDRLVRRGVKEEVGIRTLRLLQDKNSQFFVKNHQNVDRHFVDWLGSIISVGGAIEVKPPLPRRVAFIGPTGVGKTTTIAKIAAQLYAVEKKKVALVTVDTYRLAAEEQLRVYAREMRIPLSVAYDSRELGSLFHEYRNMDIILMDTAGRSPFSVSHLKELRSLLQGWPIERYLVMSATTRFDDLKSIYNRFSLVNPTRLIVTKTDETRQLGVLLNIATKIHLPIAYLTHGQEVPDDIRVAVPHGIASLIVGEGEDR